MDGKPTYSHEISLLEGLARNNSGGYDRVLDMEMDMVRLVRPFDKELSEIISERNLKRRIERSEKLERDNGRWVYSSDRMKKIN